MSEGFDHKMLVLYIFHVGEARKIQETLLRHHLTIPQQQFAEEAAEILGGSENAPQAEALQEVSPPQEESPPEPVTTRTKVPWSAAEDAALRALWEGGAKPSVIARQLGRPINSIYTRKQRLELSNRKEFPGKQGGVSDENLA